MVMDGQSQVLADSSRKLDEIDVILGTKDGQIERGRDPQRCRHNARQKCSYCLPLDPYDEEYLKEKEIKHMSFHAHCRKLMSTHGKGTSLKKPLETVKLSVDLNCPAHKPYPKGVCTKCRPPTVTLNRQKFRHVDNVCFENEDVVNEFLNYWRKSNEQRAGYLIGRYEECPEVPLGIRAIVLAIYEPPQEANNKCIKLVDEGAEGAAVDKLCAWLDVRRVGWIFTDLFTANAFDGSVHCTRHAQSYLLSAEECITAGALQVKYPNPTQFCSDGVYGSKFVTVVASGDESEKVSFHGYQVSNQCMQLVEANLLCPTNHYELAYIRETPLNEQHYIPDVQYTEKNEYGAEVRRVGRPLPVEFLMVDVPAGMPKEYRCTFHIPTDKKFPIENRSTVKETQTAEKVAQFCEQFSLENFLDLATNFHFLLYLLTQKDVPFTDEELRALCDCVKTGDREGAREWAATTDHWTALVALSHHSQAPLKGWNCRHCTFSNRETERECTMCGLPNEAAH
ncbi:hypothetical protein PMAYCL1PPCAC_06674 [Pristionchus mayeri]|uniref:Nuclear protein localization protein 4 homolog n=1 Tax=Pristionchus mayeri TaxID=1317129 RepID=A0AAN4ZBB5_9BILA|nr:hypothetical protein PMAYCL1PPCAC_06674 [Pristionchus mayeri]